MDCFNHDKDFKRFTTHGMVYLLVTEVMNIDGLDKQPHRMPNDDNPEERKQWLKSVSTHVVDRIWQPTDLSEMAAVIDAAVDKNDADDYYEPDSDDEGSGEEFQQKTSQWCSCGKGSMRFRS